MDKFPTQLPVGMSESHHITEAMRQMALEAMRHNGITQTDIAEATGMGNAWVSKYLNGTLKTVRDETLGQIERVLGVRFFEMNRHDERSALANKVATLVDTDKDFAKLAALIEKVLGQARSHYSPRYIETQDMSKIGQKIIRICHQNEDKPGKVAREVLKLLSS